MDYGRPMTLFSLKFQIGQINFGAFGVFLADLSAPILVQCSESLVRCFPLINHYFYKKLSLYIQIPNIYLGLGFEFGPQRTRDSVSVVREHNDGLQIKWMKYNGNNLRLMLHQQCTVVWGYFSPLRIWRFRKENRKRLLLLAPLDSKSQRSLCTLSSPLKNALFCVLNENQ